MWKFILYQTRATEDGKDIDISDDEYHNCVVKNSQATAWTRIVKIMLQKKCTRRQWQLCYNYAQATA